ncbi:MAG: LicD family protein [Shimia sp.]|uniref:LicD family protein n=1 Tax=Shimia sp. TaxID=1954381 RepID=UPI004058686A
MYINTRPFLHTPKADTRRYQSELLDVLKDVDQLSQELCVRYSLEAGSALGAVREGGFIPWDNDADLLMPLGEVKTFLIGMARKGMFEEYDLWHYDSGWGWMIKDIFVRDILRDPDNYCEVSLNWAISRLTFGIFRVVRKQTMTVKMSLSKGEDTYTVAHFDSQLSTASLFYPKMLPEEKRTWRRRYLLDGEEYRVHPFIDIFPSVEMTPDAYIRMKRGFFMRDSTVKLKNSILKPRETWGSKLGRGMPQNAVNTAKNFSEPTKFEDYRVGVRADYRKGVVKARMAKEQGENVVLSKAPWNLKKIIPYSVSELYPLKRIPFEGIELNAPNDVVGILENHYKDFRTLPPENERIQHAYHVDPNQYEQTVRINV